MKFGIEDIERALRLGEDSAWEFKEIVFDNNTVKDPRRSNLADEIAAFANTKGGMLLCSVTDKGEVQHLTREQMDCLEKMFVEISSDSIRPPIYIKTFRHEIDKKPLLLVEIPEGISQHDSPGGSFHRVGSSKKPLTSDERLRLAQQRGQVRFLWFDKQPVPETGFQALKENLWKPLLSAESLIDPEVALEKMGLLTTDANGIRRATVAGVLLCSEHPENFLPNACITATCYRGKDRASGQIDAKTIGGPLNQQIAQAMNFSIRNMQTTAHKTPAREEISQYSKEALFEAIVNAVVHRDYSIRSSKIRLSLFTNRVEIQSPGALPNNLTVDQMLYRQSTRNELLVSILKRISATEIDGTGGRRFIMEERGDGISIINRKTKELTGKDPKIQPIDGAELCVTLPAATLDYNPVSATIKICCDIEDQPISGVDVLALFPNNTWKRTTTDNKGHAAFKLYSMRIPITIFAAAINLESRLIPSWIPARDETMTIIMEKLQGGGSVIFPDGTGQIPGLSGRLNPIRDTLDRTCLYASNIAINQGQQQPVHFRLGEELRLTDSNGTEMLIRILEIRGTSSLIEFRPITTTSLKAEAYL